MQTPTVNNSSSVGSSPEDTAFKTPLRPPLAAPVFVSFEAEPCRLASGKQHEEEIQRCRPDDPDIGFWAVNKLGGNCSKLDSIYVQTFNEAEHVLDKIDAGERPDLFEPGERLRPFVMLERGHRVIIHTAPSERAFVKAMGLPGQTHLLSEYGATFAVGTKPGLRRFDFGGWGRGGDELADPMQSCKQFLKEEGVRWKDVDVKFHGPSIASEKQLQPQEIFHQEKPSLLLNPIRFVVHLWKERESRNRFARELGFESYREFVAQTGDSLPERNGLNQWKSEAAGFDENNARIGTWQVNHQAESPDEAYVRHYRHRSGEIISSEFGPVEKVQRETQNNPILVDPVRAGMETELTSQITVVTRQLANDYTMQISKGRIRSAELIVEEATDFVSSLKGPKLESDRLKQAVINFISSDAENAALAHVELGVSATEFARHYDFEPSQSQRMGTSCGHSLRVDKDQDDLSNALRVAAKYGHNDLVAKYLAEGANVQADGNIALMEACSKGNTHTVALLINHGADPMAQHGLACHLAAAAGHQDTLAYLQTATLRLEGHSQRISQAIRHSM